MLNSRFQNVSNGMCVHAAWTELPGQRMQQDASQPGLFVASIPQTDLEFVFNNGANDWDSAKSGQNYEISGAGEYLVQKGEVSILN
jgi:hypothetical protein